MKDISESINEYLEKSIDDSSKDYKERVGPFIEKAKQSIKHPHFYYVEVDTKRMTVEYKRKKWWK